MSGPSAGSLRPGQFWLLNLLAVAAAALVVAYIVLQKDNRALKAEVQQSAAFIQQTVPLEKLNSEIIKALVAMAVKDQDRQLQQLLADHGIRFRVQPKPDGAAAQELR